PGGAVHKAAGRRTLRDRRGADGGGADRTALLGRRALSAEGNPHASIRDRPWTEPRQATGTRGGDRGRVVFPQGHRDRAKAGGEVAGASRGHELEPAVGQAWKGDGRPRLVVGRLPLVHRRIRYR